MGIGAVISLLGGLALFLFGMHFMGESLQKAAGPKLKHFLGLMTRNPVVALLTGLSITALIQSSGATTVMVVGFVNAQMLTLAQSVGVILGANVGTTVTSLLLSIPFDPGAFFAFVGIALVMIWPKKEIVKQMGYVLLGLGILFTGMDLMKKTMSPLSQREDIMQLMGSIDNPLLGVLVGTVVTALLQSSSVSVGILQVLAGSGLLSMNGAMYLVLGAQIGACTPTLMAMANTGTQAKRAAMVQLVFNVLKSLIILIISLIFPVSSWFEALVPGNPKLCISMMHIGFNLFAVAVLLPCSNLLVWLAGLIIPEKETEAVQNVIKMQYYDPRLLKNPSLAAEQLYREACRMGKEAFTHISLAVDALRTMDMTHAEEIEQHEKLSDFLEESITEGLVAVMSLKLTEQETRRIGGLFHVVNDIERISDHADNLYGLAKERIARGAKFSDKATDEISELFGHVLKVLSGALEGLEEWNITDNVLMLLEKEEQGVDDMTDGLRRKHVERLKEHKCTAKSGVIYLESINNLERVADHAMDIATVAKEQMFLHSAKL